MRHSLPIQIYLDDFKNDVRFAVESVFDIIAKAKAAVFSMGGKVLDYEFSNVPSPDENIDGMTATIKFEIATPYVCTATLHFTTILTNLRPVAVVKFIPSFK